MSIDPSLRTKGALKRHRNVLTRAERIEKLIEEEKWTEEEGPVLGLPKVAHRKSHAGRKDAKEEEKAVEALETAETTSEETATTEVEKSES
jgi:small basic protein (TIGR04137 family)